MHKVLRFGELREEGLEALEAAAETLRSMWLACFVTTFTTAVGFGARRGVGVPVIFYNSDEAARWFRQRSMLAAGARIMEWRALGLGPPRLTVSMLLLMSSRVIK